MKKKNILYVVIALLCCQCTTTYTMYSINRKYYRKEPDLILYKYKNRCIVKTLSDSIVLDFKFRPIKNDKNSVIVYSINKDNINILKERDTILLVVRDNEIWIAGKRFFLAFEEIDTTNSNSARTNEVIIKTNDLIKIDSALIRALHAPIKVSPRTDVPR